MSGSLVVLATPIGNLGDLSERARRELERCDLVACEDTRRTGKLLAHLGIKKPMVSLHEHNERWRATQVLERLAAGDTVALVSDAGTPLLSDPGFLLVRAAIERGLRVEPVPGPSALLAALVVSGLPPSPFTFWGFAPPKRGRRRTFYRRIAASGHTGIVFESPHRLLASLEDAIAELGEARPIALARELTKIHEEVLRGPLADIRATLAARTALKGEVVLVIGAGSG
jgi:16S rRNA (cytidine1402-2'-O)-methyltransferase